MMAALMPLSCSPNICVISVLASGDQSSHSTGIFLAVGLTSDFQTNQGHLGTRDSESYPLITPPGCLP
jgi:hypothetical protein